MRFNENCKNLTTYTNKYLKSQINFGINVHSIFLTKTAMINSPNPIQYSFQKINFLMNFYTDNYGQSYIPTSKKYVVDIDRFRIEDAKGLISLD